MHNAPSVTYLVKRSAIELAFLSAIWLLGAATMALWILNADAPGWPQVVTAIVLCVVGCWAAWTWLQTPAATLQWDSQGWSLSRDPDDANTDMTRGSLVASIDLQQVLLVRWQAGAAAGASKRWLWLARADCPARWNDLRRAVYSRAASDPLPQTIPLAATL